jgi:hypothetical protein
MLLKKMHAQATQQQEEATMTTRTKPIPDGYHTATPYPVITNAGKAIEFYKEAFGAAERMRLATPDKQEVSP